MAQEEKKKKNRLRYMILSIIIAIVAWAVVTYTTDPDITKTIAGIRIELTGEEELSDAGYVVINQDDLPKLAVKMRGKRSDLIKAIDKAKIIVDVSQIEEAGEFEMECAVKLPNSRITAEKISSQTVPITVEKLEIKEVPVRVIQTGELDGKIVKSVPEKDVVSVNGAKSELDMIDAVEVTVDISILKETETSELGYVLVLKDDAEREDLPTIVINENLITVTNTVYTAKELPVKVVAKEQLEMQLNESDTQVEPKTVKVGIGEGVELEHITVTIDEKAPEGEYKVDKSDGVYVPDYSKNVTVKPVWDKIN